MRNMFRHSVPEKPDPARRDLLRGAALILGLAVTGTRGLFARAQTDADAKIMAYVEDTLAQLARRLFPHDVLSAAPYTEVATTLINRASMDAELAAILYGGVAQLDHEQSQNWVTRNETRQIAAIRQIEGSRFFRIMRTATIEHLYRNREVWDLLGYQGSSVEFGGYVDRGFDDIDWLPAEPRTR